jgi:hypothetical protein
MEVGHLDRNDNCIGVRKIIGDDYLNVLSSVDGGDGISSNTRKASRLSTIGLLSTTRLAVSGGRKRRGSLTSGRIPR